MAVSFSVGAGSGCASGAGLAGCCAVFSFDKKTQIQALDQTHDYRRNGTIDLFAALNTPRHSDVHVISDNVSTDKSEPVRKWLSHPRRQRWHLHFTPHHLSWANLVESWLSIVTRKALKYTSLQLRSQTPRHHRALDSPLESRLPTPQIDQTLRSHRQNPQGPNHTRPRNLSRDTPLESGICRYGRVPSSLLFV